jgi:hypothetical protein
MCIVLRRLSVGMVGRPRATLASMGRCRASAVLSSRYSRLAAGMCLTWRSLTPWWQRMVWDVVVACGVWASGWRAGHEMVHVFS